MNCDQLKKIIPDILLNDLDDQIEEAVQAHLSLCPDCKQEVGKLTAIWEKFGAIPEEKPSPELRLRFETMLEAYKQGSHQKHSKRSWRDVINLWLEKWWPKQPIIQFATAALLLVFGIVIGSRLNVLKTQNGEMQQLRAEVQNMRRTVAISLLKQQSPTERLHGVSLSYQLEQPNSEILTTLMHTLNYDPNVNVRLATVDALYLFSNKPMIRDGLVESLEKQTSPLVQIAIIDLLVEIREKRSILVLRQLIEDNHLNSQVRERAEWGIDQL